jgi:hypothetical protein
MNAATDDRTAASAGISPAELALMRHAAAQLSPAPAASGTASAPDPFTALTIPFTPGPPGRQELWHKPAGSSHYCF